MTDHERFEPVIIASLQLVQLPRRDLAGTRV